ncbi:MAG: hypothetical protein ACM3SR_17510 [Ignavibacteriales bacterium]
MKKLKMEVKTMKALKVVFPTLEDLLNEANDSVRVVTLMKRRGSKIRAFKSTSIVPMISFMVVGTAKLPEGMIGEYVYLIGEDVAYFNEKIKELSEKSAKAEEEIRRKIEEAGKNVLSGQYTDDVVLGAKP